MLLCESRPTQPNMGHAGRDLNVIVDLAQVIAVLRGVAAVTDEKVGAGVDDSSAILADQIATGRSHRNRGIRVHVECHRSHHPLQHRQVPAQDR